MLGDDNTWYGLPVHDFPGPNDEGRTPLPEPDAVAWRVATDTYDAEETWPEAFARFLAAVDPGRVRALVVGAWEEAYENSSKEIVRTILDAAPRLTSLRALFLGDMESEECEISWIVQSDVTPLLHGFPELEAFGVRGGTGLAFPAVTHPRLRTLVVESGGMPAEAVRGIAASDFPALEHLDLWLGTEEYGGRCAVEDVAPILDGARLPRLRHLALRNSDIEDGIAGAAASAPVVARLDVLDLSMGVLTDEGAAALLAGQPLTHLKKLDLHHHYLSEPMAERLREALEPAGVVLSLDRDDAEEYEWDGQTRRFVAVGE